MLSSRELTQADFPFFEDLITYSPSWQEEECHLETIDAYMLKYKMLNGRWLVWSCNSKQIGISFTVAWSPANEKPWIGTILIHPNERMKGFASTIIDHICEGFRQSGEKAVFAGCPINQNEWIKFLANCQFEQFKVERDDLGKEYSILVRPL
ncbi:GNAT family N-acetyltransferase [Metabacillus herbersteinensis]|uniref:GNAT family N-acetyltransferase n=1 Tax=Metabacillus herbersteinensis TaxID=283816 RepID=A0ABV6GMD7_9BACI